MLSAFTMVVGSVQAARLLHAALLHNKIRSPQSFFDTTPSGRILNRFSKDIYVIDEVLAPHHPHAVEFLLHVHLHPCGHRGQHAALHCRCHTSGCALWLCAGTSVDGWDAEVHGAGGALEWAWSVCAHGGWVAGWVGSDVDQVLL